jgi:hypothetical protein
MTWTGRSHRAPMAAARLRGIGGPIIRQPAAGLQSGRLANASAAGRGGFLSDQENAVSEFVSRRESRTPAHSGHPFHREEVYSEPSGPATSKGNAHAVDR